MEKSKVDIAVEFLQEGKSFKVDDLRLGMKENQRMYVTGCSQYSNISNITKSIALKELNEIKELFGVMVASSETLRSFIKNKNIEYNFAYNYGMGAIGICTEINNEVIWHQKL